jgi:protein CpxP
MITKRAFIGMAAALALSGGLLAQGMGPGRGPRWRSERFQNRVDRLAVILDLTEQQKADAKALFDKSSEQMKNIGAQLRENQQAIAELVKTAPGDFDTRLSELAAKQGSLHSQMIVLRAKTHRDLLALLTPEQREKAEKLRGLMAPGPMGRGRRGPAL